MARLHPNVLKVRRQKRQGRRSYLTSVYSLIKVPRRVSMSDIPEDAQGLFNYRKRGNESYNPYLNSIFPGVKQESKERKFALERSEEEKLLALVEHQDVCEYITMGKETLLQHKRVTFVYNRKYTVCYFIEIFYDDAGTNSYCMKSKEYGSRERALFDFAHGRISWTEFLPLSSLSLVLPRRG